MKKIGIFYGTTSGKTTAIVEEIEFNLKKIDFETFNVENGIENMSEFDNLILVTPTYQVGELQKDWENHKENLKKIDFTGKKVGLVGLGNQFAFGESYVDAIRVLYDIVKENGAEVVGFTDNSGYSYQETHAVIDGKFVGLALDEAHQDDLTPERIENWLIEIKKAFQE
ncbi:MAG: flavodoxin [Fusobacteriaceae bacterium]